MGKLSLDMQLRCNHLYGTEENPNIVCDVCDEACDGDVYIECQPDVCLYDSESSCCYPIEDCLSCPIHPGNNDPYWGLSKAEYKNGVLSCKVN